MSRSSSVYGGGPGENAELVCAIDHRLSFGDGGNSAPFASHIFVFGESSEELAEELSNHGLLLTPQEASADD